MLKVRVDDMEKNWEIEDEQIILSKDKYIVIGIQKVAFQVEKLILVF